MHQVKKAPYSRHWMNYSTKSQIHHDIFRENFFKNSLICHDSFNFFLEYRFGSKSLEQSIFMVMNFMVIKVSY